MGFELGEHLHKFVLEYVQLLLILYLLHFFYHRSQLFHLTLFLIRLFDHTLQLINHLLESLPSQFGVYCWEIEFVLALVLIMESYRLGLNHGFSGVPLGFYHHLSHLFSHLFMILFIAHHSIILLLFKFSLAFVHFHCMFWIILKRDILFKGRIHDLEWIP